MDEVGNRRSTWLKQIETRLLEMVPGDSRNWCTPVIVVLEGQPYQELITYAGKINADMIVLGIRGHSLLEKFLVGSTTDRVISRASCPVLAVRPIS
jgi:nucleotide-binding universal stress UspA family protein